MAFTVTEVTALSGENVKVWDIIADADGDTASPNIPHGLGEIPQSVVITGLTAQSRLSAFIATTIDATNIVVTKSTAAGSGNAAAQIRLIVSRNHSMVK